MATKSIAELKVTFSFGPWRLESSAVNFDIPIRFEVPLGPYYCLAIHQDRMTFDEAIEAEYFDED